MSKAIVSIYTFHLRAGTRIEDFIAANEAVQAFLEQQEGFEYRSVARQIDNPSVWVDINYWRDSATAQVADTAFMQSSVGQGLLSLLDDSTVLSRKCEIELASAGTTGNAASAA